MLWTLRDPHNFPYLDSVFPEASLMPSPLYTEVNESLDTYFSRRKVDITGSPVLPKNNFLDRGRPQRLHMLLSCWANLFERKVSPLCKGSGSE